jgi:hypothetical protein
VEVVGGQARHGADKISVGGKTRLHRLPVVAAEAEGEQGRDDGFADIGVGACDEELVGEREIHDRGLILVLDL